MIIVFLSGFCRLFSVGDAAYGLKAVNPNRKSKRTPDKKSSTEGLR